MLFGAFGRFALGQFADAGGSTAVLTAAPGSYTISGQPAALRAAITVAAGSYTINGQSIAFADKMVASAGAYAISGNAITFKINWVCAPGAYTITGSPASFSQVINGAGGGTRKFYRGRLEIARRKITITDDEGRVRKVDLLRHLKPPPPFAP